MLHQIASSCIKVSILDFLKGTKEAAWQKTPKHLPKWQTSFHQKISAMAFEFVDVSGVAIDSSRCSRTCTSDEKTVYIYICIIWARQELNLTWSTGHPMVQLLWDYHTRPYCTGSAQFVVWNCCRFIGMIPSSTMLWRFAPINDLEYTHTTIELRKRKKMAPKTRAI